MHTNHVICCDCISPLYYIGEQATSMWRQPRALPCLGPLTQDQGQSASPLRPRISICTPRRAAHPCPGTSCAHCWSAPTPARQSISIHALLALQDKLYIKSPCCIGATGQTEHPSPCFTGACTEAKCPHIHTATALSNVSRSEARHLQ